MFPTKEAIRSTLSTRELAGDRHRYLLRSLLRIHSITEQIQVVGQPVAIFGSGSGVEAFYLRERGAHVTAVDNFSLAEDPWFAKIDLLYDGVQLQHESVEEWIIRQPNNFYPVMLAFYTVEEFLDQMTCNLAKSHRTTFPKEVYRVLRPGGILIIHGDTLRRPFDLQPLKTELVQPKKYQLVEEVNGLNYVFVNLVNFDRSKFLKATKPLQ